MEKLGRGINSSFVCLRENTIDHYRVGQSSLGLQMTIREAHRDAHLCSLSACQNCTERKLEHCKRSEGWRSLAFRAATSTM